MENASKALIIAGAILLSILIIALGIYVFNMAKGATNTNSLDELEVSQFNQLFTNYRGRQIGSGVSSLLDKLISNATTNKDADDRLPDLVYFDTRTTGAVDPSKVTGSAAYASSADLYRISDDDIEAQGFDKSKAKLMIISDSSNTDQDSHKIKSFGALRAKISERHYYQVGFITDDQTGLIKGVLISY